jgi:lactate racemase
MKKDFYLCMGPVERRPFALPEKWRVAHFVESDEAPTRQSVEEMAREAIFTSQGIPLKTQVAKAGRIAVIVDDKTRPTPAKEILGVLLPELSKWGHPKEDTIIVMALGTHVPMDAREIEEKLGKRVAEEYTVVQHSAWQDDLVPIKVPGWDTGPRINPEVARADLKIGLSSILPHPMAGYGGGPKILMPGVCNFEFIRDHHMKYTIDPHSRAGLTKGNPFHEACMNVAKAIGLDFSINCVYDQQARLVSIVAGGLEDAFSKAVGLCVQKLGITLEEKVDITITSTYPHIHGHQFCKGLSAPDVITRDTGAVLMVVPLVTPVIDEFVNSFDVVRQRSLNNSTGYVRDAMSKGMPFLPDKPVEFNMAMSCVILRRPIRTILVSPVVARQEAATMGLEYASSVEEGIRLLEEAYPEAEVAIFPAGGLILPVVEEMS